MNKILVPIPSGFRYLSEVRLNGEKFVLPNGILNKELTGCGGTTLALKDESKTVICSPRIKLLENKAAQFPETLFVKQGVTVDEIKHYIKVTEVPKILTTYDSFRKVQKAIRDFSEWKVVVDEFQCLLNDSAFKAETELAFLKELQSCPYVTYMSATPILDRFISQIPELKDKPYYQLQWADKQRAVIRRIKTPNPAAGAIAVIKKYQQGYFPFIKDEDGNRIESKEAVLFINSVTDIVNIIDKTALLPEEVNIIVANKEENKALIKKLGEEYTTGTIPLKGEEHKKFTFCTSTAYMGVDFYSTSATTFVISNVKKGGVDIATELCQIAGRQRLESNPFRNLIYFIYNTAQDEVSEEEFERNVEGKKYLSLEKIRQYAETPEPYKPNVQKDIINTIKTAGIQSVYLSYNPDEDSFVFNDLALLSDRLAYEVQNYTYRNGLMIKKELEAADKFELAEDECFEPFSEYLRWNIQKATFREKMKKYIDSIESPKWMVRYYAKVMAEEEPKLKYYCEALGADKIRALSCDEANLVAEIDSRAKMASVEYHLKQALHSGQRITKADLKNLIQQEYDRLSLKKTAKATDIEGLGFDTKEVKINVNGKYVNGFEIYER